MQIIDEENKNINFIMIQLNKAELKQLMGYIKQLIEEYPHSDHYHLSDYKYEKEILICLNEE